MGLLGIKEGSIYHSTSGTLDIPRLFGPERVYASLPVRKALQAAPVPNPNRRVFCQA